MEGRVYPGPDFGAATSVKGYPLYILIYRGYTSGYVGETKICVCAGPGYTRDSGMLDTWMYSGQGTHETRVHPGSYADAE